MRTLERNKRTIHYAQLIGSTPIKDEYGNETGEYANEYSPPVPYRIHVSAARGEYTNAQFGGIAHYDRCWLLEHGVPLLKPACFG